MYTERGYYICPCPESGHQPGCLYYDAPATPGLSERELAHVLAALRYCDRNDANLGAMDHFEDIEGGPLSGEEVDALCQRLNQ